MHDTADNDLLAKIQQGDHQAFSTLVDRHGDTFYRLAFSFLNTPDLAQDVVQDAFLWLWENPLRWNPKSKAKFTTWFYRIIVNRSLDVLKKKGWQPLEDIQPPELETQSVEEQNPQINQLLTLEQHNQLSAAMAQLPQNQQIAINFCFLEGTSNQEAADIMKISLKALQSLIMRAKTNLKKQLQKDQNHE